MQRRVPYYRQYGLAVSWCQRPAAASCNDGPERLITVNAVTIYLPTLSSEDQTTVRRRGKTPDG